MNQYTEALLSTYAELKSKPKVNLIESEICKQIIMDHIRDEYIDSSRWGFLGSKTLKFPSNFKLNCNQPEYIQRSYELPNLDYRMYNGSGISDSTLQHNVVDTIIYSIDEISLSEYAVFLLHSGTHVMKHVGKFVNYSITDNCDPRIVMSALEFIFRKLNIAWYK